MAIVSIELRLDADQFQTEAGQTEQVAAQGSVAFDSFSAKATGAAFAFNQIADVAQRVGEVLAVPIQKFSALQTSMAQVESLGVPNIQSMTDEVVEMSERIAVPLDSLTGGLYEVVSAGVDASNQIEVLEISARAAQAGVTDTNQALRLASAVVKGYGLEWSETEGVMDRAFQTVKLGQTTFPELANNLGAVVPLASALKLNMDELFGSFATLTGVTGNTSEVATQLRAVMQGLADPTDELTQLIEQQTGQTVEQAVASEGLAGILAILAEATGGSATQMNNYFGRVEAVNAALALGSSQFDTFRQKTDAMTESTGAMSDAQKTANETYEAQLQILENRWDAAMIGAVAVITPVIDELFNMAEAITDTTTAFDRLETQYQNVKDEMSELTELDELIGRYEELQDKTNLSRTEHDELKGIIETLSGLYPTAVTRVNEYGEAVEISAGKVRQLVDAQRALLRAQERELLEDTGEQLRDNIEILDTANERLAEQQQNLEAFRQAREDAFKAEDIAFYTGAIEGTQEAIRNIQDETKTAAQEIDQDLIPVLTNFFDFDTQESELARSLGLNQEQVNFLIQRWESLNAQVDQTQENAEETPDVPAPSVEQPDAVEVPFVPVPFEDLDVTDAVLGDFERLADEQLEINELKFDQMLISEQEFADRKLQILASSLENARVMYGEESVEFLRTRQEMIETEQQFATEGRKLTLQDVQFTIGQFEQLGAAFQGVSEEMFAVGKASAIAQTVIDTFQAAQAAYKAMAGIPVVGPALAVAAAAAAVAAGFGRVQQIRAQEFESRKEGGFLGDEIRTVAAGNFGGGENRLIIANADEFIVNAQATRANRAILEAINAGTRPLRFQGGGQVPGGSASGSGVSLMEEFARFRSDMVEAIRDVRIELRGTMDGQEFLRENFQEFEVRENSRRF